MTKNTENHRDILTNTQVEEARTSSKIKQPERANTDTTQTILLSRSEKNADAKALTSANDTRKQCKDKQPKKNTNTK